MMNGIKSTLVLTMVLMVQFAQAQINPQFVPIPASFNISSANPIHVLDVPYDDLDTSRQAFHLFLPDSTGPHPLVVYIHGGGFTGGSRDVVLVNPARQADIKYFLERGIAFASFGYRLLSTNQQDTIGVKKSLYDSKRALQFIRHHAGELYINPEVVAFTGTSAGAGTALWIATRPDMADPNDPDPVFHESTRVCALELSGCQSTYDLYKWETEVYQNFDGQGTNYTVDSMVNDLGLGLFSNFYGGIDSNYHFLYDPALIQYREDVDMLSQLSSDDPPVYIKNGSGATHPSQDLYHHSSHGKVLHDASLAANLPEVKADIQALGINTTNGESGNEFLLRYINSCVLATGLDPQLQKTELKVYPVPAKLKVNLSTGEGELISQIKMYALSGKLLLEKHHVHSHEANLELTSIPRGIYLLKVMGQEGSIWNKKVVVE